MSALSFAPNSPAEMCADLFSSPGGSMVLFALSKYNFMLGVAALWTWLWYKAVPQCVPRFVVGFCGLLSLMDVAWAVIHIQWASGLPLVFVVLVAVWDLFVAIA